MKFFIFLTVTAFIITACSNNIENQNSIQVPIFEIGRRVVDSIDIVKPWKVLIVLKGDSIEKYKDTSLYKGASVKNGKNELLVVDSWILNNIKEATLIHPKYCHLLEYQTTWNLVFLAKKGTYELSSLLNLFKNLQRLCVQQHDLKETFPKKIQKLTKLVTIDVSGNDLNYLDYSLANFRNLETLYVHNNALSIIPDTILKLPKLKYLDVRNNYLTNSFIDSIKSAYPKIKIVENNPRGNITFENNKYTLELTYKPYLSKFPELNWNEHHRNKYTELYDICLPANNEYYCVTEMENLHVSDEMTFIIYFDSDAYFNGIIVYNEECINRYFGGYYLSDTFYTFKTLSDKQIAAFSICGSSDSIPTLKIYRKIEKE